MQIKRAQLRNPIIELSRNIIFLSIFSLMIQNAHGTMTLIRGIRGMKILLQLNKIQYQRYF